MFERTEVQDLLLRYAAQIGWTFIPHDDAHTLRGGRVQAARPEELFRAMLDELMRGRVRARGLSGPNGVAA